MLRSIVVGAEELHAMGQANAGTVKRWLDATGRFRITHDVYTLNPRTNEPLSHVRLPQLRVGDFERFDLRGELLDEDGQYGNTLLVECKDYSEDGNQGVL